MDLILSTEIREAISIPILPSSVNSLLIQSPSQDIFSVLNNNKNNNNGEVNNKWNTSGCVL